MFRVRALFNFPRSHLTLQIQLPLKQCPLLFHLRLLPLLLRLPLAPRSLQSAPSLLEEPSPLQPRSHLPGSPQLQRRLQRRKWLPNLQLLTILPGKILSRYITNSTLHPSCVNCATGGHYSASRRRPFWYLTQCHKEGKSRRVWIHSCH
jgi:hypothetical protein